MRTFAYLVAMTFFLTSLGFVTHAGAPLKSNPAFPVQRPLTAESLKMVAANSSEKDVKESLVAVEEKNKATDDDINRFTNTIVLIKDFYVKKVGDRTLLDDAIRGMVSGLDPHSEYLDGDAYKALMMTTSGEFGGVGIEVTPEYGILKVVSPIDDTPAMKAGMKAGDYIVAINGKMVSEMSMQDAVDNMRGKAGSAVTLTVLRKGKKTPLTFKLKRQMIKIASVKSRMLDPYFGYVRITQFQEPTGKLMRNAIKQLKADNKGQLRGIVLDLRNNPGGLLETAVEVADTFLDKKQLQNKYKDVIVYTEGRLPEAQYSAKASGTDLLDGAPIVILINNGSASASEIVAGALQDYQRALVVGMPSFGKGSVQTVIPLDKEHALKLTTALYHTPSGRIIQNVGIIPDVQIEDLKIAKANPDEDLSMLEPIKEYQLKGHLAGAEQNGKLPELLKNESGLASSDFQLFEALKILRTIYMLEGKHKTRGSIKPGKTVAAETTTVKP